MSKEAMIPFGLALESYYKGDKNGKIIYHRDDGGKTEDLIKGYFRNYSEFSDREKIALKHCQGRILDIGAGAGPHALELQKKGFDVTAIDISEKACEIMRNRGVEKVRCVNAYEISERDFDTILILGCSIGFVEDLKGLKMFLEHSKGLLSNNGMIIMDSRDVRMTNNPHHIKYQQNNIKNGKYRGEIRIQIEFQGRKGKMFQILHVDPEALKKVATALDFNCEILSNSEEGLYLAKLSYLS